jgi:predicted metal-dependent peptidase
MDSDKVKKTYSIIQRAKRIIQQREYFYYNVLKQMKFIMVPSERVPTAGVAFINGSYTYMTNPDFTTFYTPEEFHHILLHEVEHFIFGHCKDFKDKPINKNKFKTKEEAKEHIRRQQYEKWKHQLQNIAMDRSINVYIPNLPKIRQFKKDLGIDDEKQGKEENTFSTPTLYKKHESDENYDIYETEGITEESFKRLLIKSKYQGDVEQIERFQSWRYYYDLLKSCPDIKEQCQKIKTMDVHFQPGSGNPGEGGIEIEEMEGQDANGYDEAMAEEQRKEMLRKAAKQSNKSSIPGHMRAEIDLAMEAYNAPPLPWNKMFRRQLNKAKEVIFKKDINIRNTQYNSTQVILTGYMYEPKLDIYVVQDVSGSCMSPQEQGLFWNEVKEMSKNGTLHLYYCDTEVEREEVFKYGKKIKDKDYKAVGGGGTDLDVGIKKAIDNKAHIIIMLTDGYMNYNLTSKDLKGHRVITVTTGDSPPNHYGPSIKVNVEG